MEKFICYTGKRILFVSSRKPENTQSLPCPNELKDVKAEELLKNYIVREGKVLPRLGRSVDARSLRVALVGVYGIDCGISTYNEKLFPHICNEVKEAKIFTENTTRSKEVNLLPCFERSKPMTRLAEEIRHFNPDVIHIQHEFGIFPKANHWLALLNQLSDFPLNVMFHSVYRHPDKRILTSAVDQILVHTDQQRDVLRGEGIQSAITIIPHGAEKATLHKYWNIYGTKHKIIQAGFGFKYKGWENSLMAVKKLKEKYPDVFFTGIFSESPFTDHSPYFQELQDHVKRLGIEENVAIIRGFKDAKVLDSFFRTNTVAVYPYVDNGEHKVYSCSGAARLAMSHGIPVITSSEPLFYDIKDVVPQADDVEGLVKAIDSLFANPERVTKQIEKQCEFLEQRTWEEVAKQYVDSFVECVNNQRS